MTALALEGSEEHSWQLREMSRLNAVVLAGDDAEAIVLDPKAIFGVAATEALGFEVCPRTVIRALFVAAGRDRLVSPLSSRRSQPGQSPPQAAPVYCQIQPSLCNW
jgi:hypothetical protein